jgi:stage II sporulation protein D
MKKLLRDWYTKGLFTVKMTGRYPAVGPVVLFIFILFFAVKALPARGESAVMTPSTIRVGLFYGATAKGSYRLASEKSFTVGFKRGKELVPVLNINNEVVDVVARDSEDFAVVAGNIKNMEEALGILEKLLSRREQAYLFFDGQWAVMEKVSRNASSGSSADLIEITGSADSKKIILPLKMDSPVFVAGTVESGLISLNGRRYRGIIEFLPSDKGKITAVNELGLEEYLYGVVPTEMPPNWPMEALKAQAVASRTYAVYNLSKMQKFGFDVSAGNGDQVYGGYDVENKLTNRAVDETRGQLILYDQKPILAMYHADSGGVTEDSAEVFGFDLPYLKGMEDTFVEDSTQRWEVNLSLPELSKRLADMAISIGEVRGISVLERSPSGRVKKILLSGSLGQKVLSSSEIRNVLQLKSTLFDITGGSDLYMILESSTGQSRVPLKGKYAINENGRLYISADTVYLAGADGLRTVTNSSGDYKLVGRGYGHGVGMSQLGARAMAQKGYNYIEILQHYYKNVEIK